MAVFKSPGVYISETDFSSIYPKLSKNYLRKSKISKIFGLDNKSTIITSTPKGPNNFPKQINDIDHFEKIFGKL
jgi:hypothetical protein